jgi:hypothetical protein
MISSEELESLEAPFSEKEIKDAVFSCYHEGALALMVYLFCFLSNLGR